MIKIEMSELAASCLQRMIVTEIDNQRYWKRCDKEFNLDSSCRDEVINLMKDLQEQIEKQGIKKFIKCN